MPRAAPCSGEGPTEQGKGTLLAAPCSLTFISKAFLSSTPPTPPGLLQPSGEALVWRAGALHKLTPAQGRALRLEVPGQAWGALPALRARPELGGSRAWPL